MILLIATRLDLAMLNTIDNKKGDLKISLFYVIQFGFYNYSSCCAPDSFR